MVMSGDESLILVSGNPNKGIEAERILGTPLLRVAISLPEIQASGVDEITRYKLEVARVKGYGRLIVEDVALGFDELGNFPGPYVKWLLEAAGGKGLGAIAYALLNRSAKAQCCIAPMALRLPAGSLPLGISKNASRLSLPMSKK